ACIQRRNVLEALAAGGEEVFAVADRDLLERLEAIDREAGTKRLHALHALGRQLPEHFIGVRREPRLAPDARLERDDHLVLAKIEPLAERARGRLALAEVRI